MKNTRWLFRCSRAIHKYTGLVCALYFLLMAISGILINHPDVIRSVSLPGVLTPGAYGYKQWNRMALRDAVFSSNHPDTLYVAGRAGVLISRDNGRTFSLLDNNFPCSAYDRETYDLLLVENQGLLYAATRAGLYVCSIDHWQWQKILLDPMSPEKVVSLAKVKDQVLACTPHACYLVPIPPHALVVQKASLFPEKGSRPQREPLFRFLLRVHDGSVLGFPGKLFIDAAAMGLIFLSLSAIYIWLIPWQIRRGIKCKLRMFRFFHKYHIKTGIYISIFLIIFALTGILIRPPFIMTILPYSVPAQWLSASTPDQDWPFPISRVLYQEDEDRLILAAGGKFYSGPGDFSRAFTRMPVMVRVSGMGVTVFEQLRDQRLLIGSFSGLYIWNQKTNQPEPLLQFARGSRNKGVSKRQGMVSAALVRGKKLSGWVDYRKGLQLLDSSAPSLVMPKSLAQSNQLSLWYFLFEFHNGRIFRDWLGTYVWLVVPVGGILLLINSITGFYDWLYKKNLKKRRVMNK